MITDNNIPVNDHVIPRRLLGHQRWTWEECDKLPAAVLVAAYRFLLYVTKYIIHIIKL